MGFEYIRADDFFRNASVTTIAEDVRRDIRRENRERNNGAVTTSEAYRACGINGEAWSKLGSQVVGAEILQRA